MSQSTSDKVRDVLNRHKGKWSKGGNYYRGVAPYRNGSDGQALAVTFIPNEPEFGYFKDFNSQEKGTLYDLAKLLGIEPNHKKIPASNSRKAKSLADYEKDKSLPQGWLANRGWTQGTHKNRPCIFIPAADGTIQVRFLDELEPRFIWKESRNGQDLPFYGSARAVEIAQENGLNFILLCNGAGSVESAQYRSIPAMCVLGGEDGFSKKHADKIVSKYDGYIVIALDCDSKGRKATQEISNLLGDRAVIIDIDMGDKSDIADFCKLWSDMALERIQDLARKSYQYRRPRNAHEALDTVIAQVKNELPTIGRFVEQPISLLHQFGGYCLAFEPNMLTGVIGLSGHGKTSFWHSIVNMLIYKSRRYGFIVDGREFSPESDSMRRVQMTSFNRELSYDAIMLHKLALQEIDENVPKHERIGKLLSDENLNKLVETSASNKKYWVGHVEYAEEYPFIEDTLDYMKRRTVELRSKGTFIDMWIFDYLTLYKARGETLQGRDGTISNIIAQTIKDACRSVNVHGLVMLQPNKTPTIEQLAQNKRLTVRDMSYVNENHFNLILALNTLYGQKAFTDDNGKSWYAKKNYGEDKIEKHIMDMVLLRDGSYACVIEVLKNSVGMKNHVNIRADFANLRWIDKSWASRDLCLPFLEEK